MMIRTDQRGAREWMEERNLRMNPDNPFKGSYTLNIILLNEIPDYQLGAY